MWKPLPSRHVSKTFLCSSLIIIITLKELFLCFYSSSGQNLQVSNYMGDVFFAVFIAILGLVLFALLISNIQVIHDDAQFIDFAIASSSRGK